MRDYKYDSAVNGRPHRRGWIIVGLLLVGAAGAGGWILSSKSPTPSKAVADQLSPKAGKHANATAQAAPADQEKMLSSPLALPPQTKSMPAAKSPANAALSASPASTRTLEEHTTAAATTSTGAAAATSEAGTANDGSGLPAEPQLVWSSHKIVSGDTLSAIFKAKGLSAGLLHQLVHSSKQAAKLADIRPGQTLRFQIDEDGKLHQLVWVKSPLDSLHITQTGDNFEAEWVNKNVDSTIAAASGTIQSSLFAAAKKAGLDYAQVLQLAALFRSDINFSLDIRPGDQFRVLYEKRFLDGKQLGNGPIVAAEFTNLGTTYTAFRFEDAKGNVGYYNKIGHNKRRAFMRAPLKYVRISSRFSKHRWDPYLKRWGPHKGVDFAAPTGTPIEASANGRIVFRGQQRGFGNVVILKNGRKYETLYAHMSRFASNQRVGERVREGEVIGYVGMTGWATGPHLHYEFHVNGVPRNPLTVKLPLAPPVPRKELAQFKSHIAPLVADLASANPGTMVATNDSTAR